MAKNKVQYQKGLSINGFLKKFGTEEQCEKAIFNWRYPCIFRPIVNGHSGST